MKSKVLKGILIALVSIVMAVLLVLAAFSIGESFVFFSFYSNAEPYQKMPGLYSGYTHQGYTLLEDEQVRLSCGYMSNGKASRIYIMPEDGSPYTFVEMKNADGSDYTGHTGGIAVCGDVVYITSKAGLDIFSYADIMDGDGIATKKSEFATINDPAYCTIHNGVLYAGSFYREGNYETPAEHRITTPAGDKNTAIITAYTIDKATGLPAQTTPFMIYSTTGLVQGMAFTDDGKVILSTSYGLAKSHLLVYDIAKLTSDGKTFTVDQTSVPVKYIDSASLVEDIVAPPMSEEIIYKDGVIYIMNESASNKYIFGMLTSGTYVYGYRMK